MAVIKELNGGKIRIHNDSMGTKEEDDLAIQRASKIMIDAAYRRLKEEQEKQKEKEGTA